MLKVKNHIIKTLCFDAQVADEATAVAFADKLRTIDCELLLNNVFKKYDAIAETIRLDRVELDIGIIELDEMNNIGGEIFRQLEDTLDRLLKGKLNRNPLTLDAKIAADEISSRKIKSIEADIELLIHYLKTGSLPWNRVDSPDMEELLLNILQTGAAKLRMALVPELDSNIVIKRISTVFRYSTVVVLLKNLLDEDKFRQIENFSALVTEQISVLQIRNVENELVAIYLSCVNSSVQQNQNFIAAFIALLQPLLNRFSTPTLKTIQGHIRKIIQRVSDDQQNYFYRNVIKIIVQIIKTKETSDEVLADSNLNSVLTLKDETELVKSGKQDSILKDETELVKSGKQDSILKDEKIDEQLEENDEQQYYFLDNAGLVLLNWALIQNSLEQLGWVKERQIVDEQSQHKILIWMDYLVWGQRRIHEYGLMLNKVLIGMHPADVADIHKALTGKEKKAADELLNTVIEYWSVLKSTSIKGLRTAFLQRNGKLSNEDGGWQMHVESKGYDMLIDSLPWTYTIIKSPWMEKPLFTQWSTKV